MVKPWFPTCGHCLWMYVLVSTVSIDQYISDPPRCNGPRSIYQYSNMNPRLSGQNCKFLKFLLSHNSQKRLGNKENNTNSRSLSRKPRSHVRILIYRMWPIKTTSAQSSSNKCKNYLLKIYLQHGNFLNTI